MKRNKRLFTLAMLVSANLMLYAQNLASYVSDFYQGTLCVSIDGKQYEDNDISLRVEKCADGNLIFYIDEYRLARDGDTTAIGNIRIPSIALERKEGTIPFHLSSRQTIKITNGTLIDMPDDVVDTEKKDDVTDIDDTTGSGSDKVDDTTSSESDPESTTTTSGTHQDAEGEWGDDEGGTSGSGTSGSGTEGTGGASGGGTESGGNTGSGNTDTPATPRPPQWYGPTYGAIMVVADGNIYEEYADMSFDVYIPYLSKSVFVTFRSGNEPLPEPVPTRISHLQTSQQHNAYSITGMPVSSAYKGIVVCQGKKYMKAGR